ncbi:MAG: hypothetical protein ACTSO2_04705 [Promethearchaeota archaeon]
MKKKSGNCQNKKKKQEQEQQPSTVPVEEKASVEGQFVVINPEGKEETIDNPTPEVLVKLDMEGYSLPTTLRSVIPRYCPKCGNFNQRMIFERTDKNHILLDYPRIYALKTVCGNCGCEWDQNTRKILYYKKL